MDKVLQNRRYKRALLLSFVIIHFCTRTAESQSIKAVLSGPDMEYIRNLVVFQCKAPTGLPPATYELLKHPGEVVLGRKESVSNHVSFSISVRKETTGNYFCRVTRTKHPATNIPLKSNSLYFQAVVPVRGAFLVANPHPPVLYEGGKLTLHCQVQSGTHFAYHWYCNQTELKDHLQNSILTINKVSQDDAGSYYCLARNNLNNTRVSYSNVIQVTVKALFSKPYITLSVNRSGPDYGAEITCQSDRGTPPVSFELFLNGKVLANKTVGLLKASFSLPVLLNENMGELQCWAANEVQHLPSEPLALEVVSVGGNVQLLVDYLYDANSHAAAILVQCIVDRGTFPVFSWLLNGSQLEKVGYTHVITNHGRCLFISPIASGRPGYYRCQVRDNFENTFRIQSQESLIEMKEPNVIALEVIAIAFCIFLLLVIVGSVTVVFVVFKGKKNRLIDSRYDIFDMQAITPSAPSITDDELKYWKRNGVCVHFSSGDPPNIS